MTRVLSEKGQDMLALLPPYLADDDYVQAIIDTHARELQRVEDATAEVLATMFPGSADDTYGFLSLWESVLGLPVAPSDASVAQRQTKVLAGLRKRNAGAGSDWIELLDAALGGTQWSYVEANPVTDPYKVIIYVPFEPGSYQAGQIQALARQITPAHIDVTVSTGQGFVVGVSLVGPGVL